MKKRSKILGIPLLLLLLALGTVYIIYNEPLPEGRTGTEADALAHKMLRSLNYETYRNTRFLEWSFRGGKHQYKWDKTNGIVEVQWDGYIVNVDLITPESSVASKDGIELESYKRINATEKAIEMFNNDSFWLVAPYKVMDKGTERKIIPLSDGLEGLLVTYTSGGSTPGDSYLWILQPNGFPKSFKMWVAILPIGGIEATWDEWAIMESGAFLPKNHTLGPITLKMRDVRAYNR
ncbi:hypothetical protein ACOCEA_08815 [Maribacter sp. CXY002]|uniref:hypothetical protein n=1 Tax=Maribacter luteocoastalis TaxID=3407671 RepID=UPI003B682501